MYFREGIDAKEDPIYGTLFSLSGTLKTIPICRKNLYNQLWFNFCESINYDNERKVIFTPNTEFTETLLNLKSKPEFARFSEIIDIVNNNSNQLFNDINNLKEFIELCEMYGKKYGLIDSNSFVEEPKDLDFVIKFLYHGLLCNI